MEENNTLVALEIEQLQIIKEYLAKFYNLWDTYGLSNREQIARVQLIWNYMEQGLQSALDDEMVQYKVLEDQVTAGIRQMEKLCTILSIEPKEEFGADLTAKKDNLIKEIKRLKDVKHERLKKYQGLRGVEAVYCRLLGAEKIALTSFSGIPSENNLLEIESHIKELSQMQNERQRKFARFQKELSTIFEETELTPETSFEREVISCNDASSLSDDTFRSLEEILSHTQQKKAELEEQKELLLCKLSSLWEDLSITESKRMQFLSCHIDCKVSTINALQNEVDICEKIKQEKFKNYLKLLEDDLKRLWDKCYVTDSVKSCFSMQLMHKTMDEAIYAYEQEISKWKKHYDEASDILNKVERRQKLWDMLIEFEENSTNPHRLQNRGGRLLQEEKDRKKLQKELPALEDRIFSDIDIYHSKFGKPFLFYGEDYRNYVTRQWQDRRNKKDDEKLERLRRHSTEMDKEILLHTPLKKPSLKTPNSVPCQLPKSKIGNDCTPMSRRFLTTPSSFKRLVLPKEHINPTLNAGIRGRLFSSSSSGTSQEEEQNDILKELNRLHIRPDQSKCTTYSTFADELDSSARCDLRSSILSDKKSVRKKAPRMASKQRRKSLSKSVPKSMKVSRVIYSPSPVRGKLGLPFLM